MPLILDVRRLHGMILSKVWSGAVTALGGSSKRATGGKSHAMLGLLSEGPTRPQVALGPRGIPGDPWALLGPPWALGS